MIKKEKAGYALTVSELRKFFLIKMIVLLGICANFISRDLFLRCENGALFLFHGKRKNSLIA